ncbi:polysaccharide deacetylase family protein [Gorillibacterium timonense]|uniref:polysaccharide deacetylase family protein n=1 Tax=Gorillibacterium timonense TaxID=1689269 RepID=UPI0009EA0E40|nr:polysaccharide deacetylase family protein [Gorillibacterium timonense]
MSLVEALGYSMEDRLLIVNADDFGMCRSANEGIRQLLEEGAVSSSTLMMPCAWAKDAAKWSAAHPEYDVGVHLTLTSEWDTYKWGPVTREESTATLVTNEGYFPEDVLTVELQAEDEQVERELKNQVKLAIAMGMDPTHLDSHMGSVYGLATGRHFLNVVFDICAEYGLPFRMPRQPRIPFGEDIPEEVAKRTAELAALADARGVVILDYLLGLPFSTVPKESYEEFRGHMADLLRSMRPGVSEIIIHPSRVTDELTAIHSEYERRGMEWQIFRDPFIQNVLKEEGIHMIVGWICGRSSAPDRRGFTGMEGLVVSSSLLERK